jgi:hypothetical protein
MRPRLFIQGKGDALGTKPIAWVESRLGRLPFREASPTAVPLLRGGAILVEWRRSLEPLTMTLKEILLQELETADDGLLTETIAWVRSRKGLSGESLPSRETIRRGAKVCDLLKFAGTWVGGDLEECLADVYATRSKAI